ncbi:unnamed protein product [Effrenium voratum]|nr:unnamed protein product [Effrenium voratum]
MGFELSPAARLVASVSRVLVLCLVAIHWLACVWFAVGVAQDGWAAADLRKAPFWQQYTRSVQWAMNFEKVLKSEEKKTPVTSEEQSGWYDFVRRTRLFFERTPVHKRYLVGPEIASKLSGKAWTITHELDFEKLTKDDGTAYLLKYLEHRLCKTPVPETGQKLEELFIRLRRPQGMAMAQWATEVREAYKRLQRALVRTRKAAGRLKLPAESTTSKRTTQEPEPDRGDSLDQEIMATPSSRAPRTTPTASPTRPGGGEPGEDVGPAEDVDSGVPEGNDGEGAEGQGDDPWWQDDSWWWSSRWWETQDEEADWQAWDDPGEATVKWDEFEIEDMEILPDEVLGWLLLRRAGLPASARLSVQSATQNSLQFADIERAMRDQEEELLQAEQQRNQRYDNRPRRTYWVEEQGQWGLVNDVAEEEEPQSIMWVGDKLPAEVYQVQEPETYGNHGGGAVSQDWVTYADGQMYHWQWHDDDFWAEDADGIWWAWSETKPWMEIQEAMMVSSDDPLLNEVAEVYQVYNNKMRTFRESKNMAQQARTGRGFFPIHQKGSFKGKKGKGGGKSKFSSATPIMAVEGKGKGYGSAKGAQRVGNPGFTGCFICGDKQHEFRNCPKRNNMGKGSGKVNAIFMVEDIKDETPMEIYMTNIGPNGYDYGADSPRVESVDPAYSLQTAFPGHAVLDSGATETVGSLEAIQELMALRQAKFGPEHFEVLSTNGKSFRFGNGQTQSAASYLLLPQKRNGVDFLLGVYTLDHVGRVPLLLSVKTLQRLGAVVDIEEAKLYLRVIGGDFPIPLQRAESGHLLLDLAADWTSTAGGENHTPVRRQQILSDTRAYMVRLKGVRDDPAMSETSDAGFVKVDAEDSPKVMDQKPKAKSKAKGKSTASKARVPTPEKYDLSRATGPDPRDPRCQGPPCHGHHREMKEGKGSLSGRNGHGLWKVCSDCRLRILYAPAYGAHGHYRQAGPLPVDTQTVVEEEIATINEMTSKEKLNSKSVALRGAEKSLEDRLQKIREQKTKVVAQDRPGVVIATDSKKAVKRNNQESPETLEGKSIGSAGYPTE